MKAERLATHLSLLKSTPGARESCQTLYTMSDSAPPAQRQSPSSKPCVCRHAHRARQRLACVACVSRTAALPPLVRAGQNARAYQASLGFCSRGVRAGVSLAPEPRRRDAPSTRAQSCARSARQACALLYIQKKPHVDSRLGPPFGVGVLENWRAKRRELAAERSMGGRTRASLALSCA